MSKKKIRGKMNRDGGDEAYWEEVTPTSLEQGKVERTIVHILRRAMADSPVPASSHRLPFQDYADEIPTDDRSLEDEDDPFDDFEDYNEVGVGLCRLQH